MQRLFRLCAATTAVCLNLLWAGAAHSSDLTVSAAASLRDAFTEIGREFEKAGAPHRVLFNFGASGQLLQQIARGAPVDVLATADLETMDRAEAQGLIEKETRLLFARNRLVLAVPSDSTLPLQSLADLQSARVTRIAIGNPDSVPAGHYAKSALEASKLWEPLRPKLVNTQSVRQALDYVSRGETETGFVYLTDAALMPDRVRVAFRVNVSTDIVYPTAVVKGGSAARAGQQFVKFLASERAQAILQKFGFERPPAANP